MGRPNTAHPEQKSARANNRDLRWVGFLPQICPITESLLGNMSARRRINCRFNGACGESFTSDLELLEHIVQHLDEGESRERLQEENNGVSDANGLFTQAKVITCDVVVKMESVLGSSLDNEASPSRDCYETEPQPLFSELEAIVNRNNAEDELVDMSNAVSMDQILQPVNPCLELVSSSPLPVLDNVNWNELLQNYPSVADIMEYEDILDASVVNESQSEDEDNMNTVFRCDHDPLSLSPAAILPHDDYCRSAEDDPEGSNGPTDVHRAVESGKNFGRMWSHVHQNQLAHRFASDLPKHAPDLKYIRGQHVANGIRSHVNSKQHRPFRQEVVTFVTKEKRTYKAIVTTPRAKPKPVNRRATQQHGQEVKYYSSEFILKEGLKKRRGSSHPLNKPYVCPVPGCGKAYKNPNGIKYHARYGHSAPQEFPCHCGKIYSTRHGLMAHKRSHSSISNSPEALEDFYSYSEPEESDEYHGNELI